MSKRINKYLSKKNKASLDDDEEKQFLIDLLQCEAFDKSKTFKLNKLFDSRPEIYGHDPVKQKSFRNRLGYYRRILKRNSSEFLVLLTSFEIPIAEFSASSNVSAASDDDSETDGSASTMSYPNQAPSSSEFATPPATKKSRDAAFSLGSTGMFAFFLVCYRQYIFD